MRKFGVEMEIVGMSVQRAQEILRTMEGISVDSNNSRSISDHTKWHVVHDGSVSSSCGQTCEVVSPILQGEPGIQELKRVCKILASNGATVNKSCGLHVHISARDLNANQIRHIVGRYARFESEIDTFMPQSRRGSMNHFCQSMVQSLRNFDVSTNTHYRQNRNEWFSPLASTVCNAISARYMKVNLQSFSKYRTIEFRQHSGSINATKVVTWIQFLQQFVNESIRTAPDTTIVNETQTQSSQANNSEPVRVDYSVNIAYGHRSLLRTLCQHANTFVNAATLARASRISETSVPSYISAIRRAYNVRIVNSRRNGYKLVWNTPASTESQVETTAPVAHILSAIPITPNDTLWAGIERDVQSYYTERTMELTTT